MSHRVKDSETELEKVFKEVIAAKKEIKHLKTVVADLQNENMLLEKQVLQAKRDKWEEICAAKQEVDGELLSSRIGQFLVTSIQTSSFLYQYCLAVHKSNSNLNFFEELDRKIEKELKNRDRITAIQSLEKKIFSNKKFKIGKSLNKDLVTQIKRHKTEHNGVPDSTLELNDSLG